MDYERVSEYIERWVGEGGTMLSQARRQSLALRPYGVIPINSTRGRFLELVARTRCPNKVLEIGPGGGYSGLWFLRGMKNSSKLEVVERNPYVAAEFEKMMKKSGFGDRVILHLGPALEVLSRLKGHYDCVFIDADKDEYPEYLKHSMRLTRRGSIILADNLFWHWSVLNGKGRFDVKGIREYTKMIFNDKRLSSLIIPLGDGLGISYRIS